MMAQPNDPRDLVLHALDLAMMREWDQAKAILEPLGDPIAGRLFLLIAELEHQDQARARSLSVIRHEIGNALSIAQANIEGIIDKVLTPTPERLSGILSSLSYAGGLLDDLRRPPEPPSQAPPRYEILDLRDVMATQVSAVESLASAKNVEVRYDSCQEAHERCKAYRGDAQRVLQLFRTMLINAVRYTPPGGAISVRCAREGGEIELSVTTAPDGGAAIELAAVTRFLRALGAAARVISSSPHAAVFTIALPEPSSAA